MNGDAAGRTVDPSLLRAAERFLGRALDGPSHKLEGGDEALVRRVGSGAGALVIHVSPPWRSRAELEWSHAVAACARREVPEAVAPIARGGRPPFAWRDRAVAVFPYVEGVILDRDDPALRRAGARTLARIHRALAGFRSFGRKPRPPSGGDRPRPPPDPASIRDPARDRWWASVRAELRTGATHGDYYRRNILCRGGPIVGVIDWHDAEIRPLALELAGAAFELCRDDEHRLHPGRAERFVAAYVEAGGPVPPAELESLLPLMRVWVRDDIRGSLASGADEDDAYVVKQARALRALDRLEGWRSTC